MSGHVALEREWHVSERPTGGDAEDPLFDVHYMLDPGDGLCSTLVAGVPKDVAGLIAAAPTLADALEDARGYVAARARVDEQDDNPRLARENAQRASATLDRINAALRAAGRLP